MLRSFVYQCTYNNKLVVVPYVRSKRFWYWRKKSRFLTIFIPLTIFSFFIIIIYSANNDCVHLLHAVGYIFLVQSIIWLSFPIKCAWTSYTRYNYNANDPYRTNRSAVFTYCMLVTAWCNLWIICCSAIRYQYGWLYTMPTYIHTKWKVLDRRTMNFCFHSMVNQFVK